LAIPEESANIREQEAMTRLIDQKWFSDIKRPSRYLGHEINAVRKDPAITDVTIALCFPDVYDIGMSHLGLKILYHILNGPRWLAAERVFTPWVDLEKAMKASGFPLTSLESERPLSHFDVVGFSLQHELCYTNVLTMLNLAGIPFLSRNRNSRHPLIIAGGPACFNPEPVAEIFDAIVVGDGEEATLSICRAVRESKKSDGTNRENRLADLRHIPGVYIPSLFRVHYKDGGPVESIEPLAPDYRVVKKAIVPDIERFPQPDSPVMPFTGVVHDRLSLEISRGCTRGCRFCQAGMIYRPVRERHPESLLRHAEKVLKNTGYEDLSLLSLSCGDYRCLQPLLRALMDKFEEDRVAVSLPSLRIDSLDPAWMEQIKRVRKTGFTLAPEAGNDRLRRIINKGLTHEEILRTAELVFGAGWNLIKLYFMVGLPGERETDLKDMVSLVKEVALMGGKRGRRAKVNASVATFVPKSHTPFMWAAQISEKEAWEKIEFLRGAFRGNSVRLKWNSPALSWLEGVFSRGDRRLTSALIEAWRMGARFDAWEEHFQTDLWTKAFSRNGIDPVFYLHRERPLNEVFPWDPIQSGVTKAYFKKEWKKAQREAPTPDCREGCLECGVCDHEKIDPALVTSWPHDAPLKKHFPQSTEKHKYRLTFSKPGEARFLGHLELVRVFIRAFKRAGIRLAYSQGFHPMPKISFLTALSVGMESLVETMDIETLGKTEPDRFIPAVNGQLPLGIEVTAVAPVLEKKKKNRIKESRFRVTFKGFAPPREALESFLNAESFPVIKKSPKGEKKVDARPLVQSMKLCSSDTLAMSISHGPGPELRAGEIVAAVFSLNKSQMAGVRIIKTGQILE